MDFLDPVLDLLEFIILLAGVCGICITITLSNNKTIRELTYDTAYDKTVSLTQGEKPLTETIENYSFTAEEIAMGVASQNSFIASPITAPNIEDPMDYQKAKEYEEEAKEVNSNILVIGSKKLKLDGRAQYDTSTSAEVLTAIKEWRASNASADVQGYRIMFSMGKDADIKDNVYQLYYLDSNYNYNKCD